MSKRKKLTISLLPRSTYFEEEEKKPDNVYVM
jgi:hypothetical protein